MLSERNPKRLIESKDCEQKNTSQEESVGAKVSSVVKCARRIRDRYSLLQVHKRAGIDIPKQSYRNLMALYQRLKQGEGLPPIVNQSIVSEKSKPQNALTPLELELYKKLIHKPIYINHATECEDKILESGNFYSTMQLKALGVEVPHRTADTYGNSYFVYFSYGFEEKINTVNFMQASNFFLINLDELAKQEPHHFASFWTAGHFFAYDCQQNNSPLVVQLNQSRIQINLNYRAVENPAPEMLRHFRFHAEYPTATLSFLRQEEVSCGRHIKVFHALRLIEYLRFFPSDIRLHVLQQQNDKQIADIFDSLFSPGKSELHIPYQQSSRNSYTRLVIRKEQTHYAELETSLRAGDFEAFNNYLKEAPNAFFYRYTYNEYSNLSLLNMAVLENQFAISELCMTSGFDPGHGYTLEDMWIFGVCTKDSLQDAIEKNQVEFIKLLCEPRVDDSEKLRFMFSVAVSEVHLCTAIAYESSFETFEFLLNHHLRNGDELIATFRLATYYENFIIMDRLLAEGIDINESGSALTSGKYKNIMPHDSNSGSPLYVAAINGRIQSVKYLIKHKADVNIRFIEAYSRKWNRGFPVLSRVIRELGDSLKPSSSRHNFDEKLHRHMPKPTTNDFIEIIGLLLAANAEIMPISHKDYYVSPLYLYTFLDINDDSILPPEILKHFQQAKLPKTPNETHEHIHALESYALILAGDEKQEPALLVGTTHAGLINFEKSVNNSLLNTPICEENIVKEHLAIPGGGLHCERHANLQESLLFHTLFQVGIDLRKGVEGINVYRKELGKTEFEINIIKLKDSFINIEHYKQTLDNAKIYLDYDGVHTMARLSDIRWIKLKDIVIRQVDYEGVLFPVFLYQDKPLPIIATVQLMKIFDIQSIQLDEIHKIAVYLYLKEKWQFDEILSKDYDKKFIALHGMGFDHRYNFNDLLTICFKRKSFKIISYLLKQGYRLDEAALQQAINLKKQDGVEDLSADLLMQLYDSHKDILNQSLLDAFAKRAGFCAAYGLSSILMHMDNKYMLCAVFGAVCAMDKESFLLHLKRVIREDDNEVCKIIKEAISSDTTYWPLHYEIEIQYNFFAMLLQDKITLSLELKKRILESLCFLIRYAGIERKQHLLVKFLEMIKIFIQPENYTDKVDYEACVSVQQLSNAYEDISESLAAMIESITPMKIEVNEEKMTAAEPAKKLVVFITSEAPLAIDNLSHADDEDYAKAIYDGLKKHLGFEVCYADKNTKRDYTYAYNNTVVHLMLNAPNTGCAIQMNWIKLIRFQHQSFVVSVLAFAKLTNPEHKTQTLNYLEHADHIIFLDVQDKVECVRFARLNGKNTDTIELASVISCTLNKNQENNDGEQKLIADESSMDDIIQRHMDIYKSLKPKPHKPFWQTPVKTKSISTTPIDDCLSSAINTLMG